MSDPEAPAPKTITIAKAGGIMAAALLLSRILGLLRDTVMTAKFGFSLDTDAYNLAVQIPDLIFMLIAGGGLSSAFIPVFSDYLHKDREDDAWNLFSVVVTICSLIAIVLILVAWFLSPQIASYLAADKYKLIDGVKVPISADLTPRIVEMGRIMLPAQFAFLVGSVIIGTLYSHKRFAAPALAPNIYNVGIIVGALVGSSIGIGIAGMSWGALIGAAIGNLVLPTLFVAKLGGRFKPSLNLETPGVKKFFTLLLPVILGFSLPSVCAIITQKFASVYAPGTNTIFKVSNNLMQAPLGIFGQALALAAVPVLSEFFAHDRMDMYRQQVSKTLRTAIYLGMPSAALMFTLAPEMVKLIYGFGKGNDLTSLDNTASCLQVYAFGIVFWCMQPVLMRGFFSIHKTARPVIMSTGITALFIAMCWFAQSVSPDFRALALVTDIAAALLAVVLLVTLEHEVGDLDKKGVALTLGKSVASSVVLGVASFGAYAVYKAVFGLSNNPHRLPLFLGFLFASLCGAWAYYFASRTMKMPETAYLDRALQKFGKKLGR